MLRERPAMTNTERQRQFRLRNPGYYARLHATRRASTKRDVAILQAQAAAAATAEIKPLLMLPAPIEPIVFPTMAELRAQREAACVER